MKEPLSLSLVNDDFQHAPEPFRAAARRLCAQTSIDKALQAEIKNLTTRQGVPTHFHVFLSHRAQDADLALGIWQRLAKERITAYLDWLYDPGLDREKVDHRTADTLRKRMQASQRFVFIDSPRASKSKWMPWELGYFDALKGTERVCVLTIGEKPNATSEEREYLQLYTPVGLDRLFSDVESDEGAAGKTKQHYEDIIGFANKAPQDLQLAVPGLDVHYEQTAKALVEQYPFIDPNKFTSEIGGYLSQVTKALGKAITEKTILLDKKTR